MIERIESTPEDFEKDLKERWLELFASFEVSTDVATQIFNDMVHRYNEPQRAYHTLEHISHCMRELQDASQEAEDARSIALALWYHDAVYEVRGKENEEKSAELAEKALGDMGLPQELRARVAHLILLTKHAKGVEGGADKDAQLLVDIDLAILGQPEEVFQKYDTNIRKEYSWVPEVQYREGRAKVLKSFLDRPYIFETEFFRKKYEEQARRNIVRALNGLEV